MAVQFISRRIQLGWKTVVNVLLAMVLIYAISVMTYSVYTEDKEDTQPSTRTLPIPRVQQDNYVHEQSTTQITNHSSKYCEVTLNIVTSFPDLLANDTYLASRGYTHEDALNRRDRQMEYLASLKMNMDHPCVEQIHLLVETVNVKRSIKNQTIFRINASLVDAFLTFSEIKGKPTYKMLAEYASEKLMGKVVVFQNADISLGEGFEDIKMQYVKDKRISYSLSRHGPRNKTSCDLWNYCIKYVGSHDTHMFYMHRPFPPNALTILDYPMNSWGAENVLMYVTKNMMRYNLRNPCSLLKVYHNHCSNVRSSQSARVNTKYSATSSPVRSLV